ncbi:hypothetical protein BC830DRAFT_6079 [Chytriomyces sp. MP71]|nr:hypothetical protein BC830DRAFT_6079 [Chytriomyces sp. MP71]
MDSGNGIKKSCMSRFVVAQLLQLGFSQEAAEHASWRLVSAMDESDGGGVAPTVDQAVQFALEFANGGSDGSHARLILPSIAAIPSDVLKASLDSASAPESGSGSVSAGTVQTDNGEDRQAPVSALDTASAPIAIPPSMIPIPGLLPAASRHPHGGQKRLHQSGCQQRARTYTAV